MIKLPMSLKTRIKEASIFAQSWAKNPLQLGALFQTSNTFAKKLISHIDWSGEYVLELGAGLGNLTEQILKSTSNPDKFGCIEVEQRFANHLKTKFSNVNVVEGSAEFLPQHFPHMVGKVRTIVSLVPMLSLPKPLCNAIIQSCAQMLDPKGFILQGSYYWKPTVRPTNLKISKVEFVWQNLPPIHLYKYNQISV